MKNNNLLWLKVTVLTLLCLFGLIHLNCPETEQEIIFPWLGFVFSPQYHTVDAL